MHPFFDDYEELIAEAFAQLHQVVDALPDEALDWVPQEGMNSTAVLITHTTGAARYWIGDVAAADPVGRVRQTEFEASNVTGDELKQRLDDCLAYIRQTLPIFTLEMLSEERRSPGHDRTFTVGWCLLHTLEHTTEHVGHLQILCQLWEAKTE